MRTKQIRDTSQRLWAFPELVPPKQKTEKMKNELAALALVALSLVACLASYFLGQKSIIKEYRRRKERRQRWSEFYDE
jgi:hypothetical protein